jgi:hypothetical protein
MSQLRSNVTLQSAQPSATFAKVTKRREDPQNLWLCIDFDHLLLLDDTVTELIITRDPATAQRQKLRLKTSPDTGNEYAPVLNHLMAPDTRKSVSSTASIL